MKNIFLLLTTFLSVAFSKAEDNDRWQILHNKRIILHGSSESENTTVTVKASDFKKDDSITISYNTTNDDKRWKRSFYINNGNNENLTTAEMNEQTGRVSVKASVLDSNIKNKQPVFIYTTAIPKDKALASRVRLRRILLCKIEWN